MGKISVNKYDMETAGQAALDQYLRLRPEAKNLNDKEYMTYCYMLAACELLRRHDINIELEFTHKHPYLKEDTNGK